jgi:hypothetical protein
MHLLQQPTSIKASSIPQTPDQGAKTTHYILLIFDSHQTLTRDPKPQAQSHPPSTPSDLIPWTTEPASPWQPRPPPSQPFSQAPVSIRLGKANQRSEMRSNRHLKGWWKKGVHICQNAPSNDLCMAASPSLSNPHPPSLHIDSCYLQTKGATPFTQICRVA